MRDNTAHQNVMKRKIIDVEEDPPLIKVLLYAIMCVL